MVEYHCGGRVAGDKDRSRSFEVRGGRRSDRELTFLHHEVFSENIHISKILFWRHHKSEAGRELSMTGSKHDRIEARRENP
ncbi:hypothetical protein YC2023_052659 [Brassica napus]